MPEALYWQKSSYSGGDPDTNCLEIATTLHLRESDAPTPTLALTPAALNALLTAMRNTPRSPRA